MNTERLGGELVIEALTMLNGCGSINDIIEKVVELHEMPRDELERLIKNTIKAGIKYGYLLEHAADEGVSLSLSSVASDKCHGRGRGRRSRRRRSTSKSRSRSRRSSRRRRSGRRG